MNIRDVKKLCKKYGVSPSKKLGQNFLVNENILKKIIKTANLSKGDVVLEIGSGVGNLTLELAKKAGEIIAIEKDKKMCEILRKVLESSNIRNVRVVNKDILKIKNGSMAKWLNGYKNLPRSTRQNLDSRSARIKNHAPGQNLDSRFARIKIVANLPYYITSPVIRKFLETKKPPKEMVLMLQKEVAQRICAKPPKMSILSVSVQFYAQPKIISYVSKNSFWPKPKVDSAIIKIIPLPYRSRAKVSQRFNDLFFRIVRAGFSHPRKQLANNLSKELKIEKEKTKNWILKNKVQPTQRAETLTIKNWQKLTKTFKIQ